MKNLAATLGFLLASSAQTLLAAEALLAGVNPDAETDRSTGIRISEGFRASVYADGIGRVRHLAVHHSGTVFAALTSPVDGKGIVSLRDRWAKLAKQARK